jgi:8-oxo-dGTP pyrophosphatase MutT (NUDIX family)/ASC-1-like (ASCH) protein
VDNPIADGGGVVCLCGSARFAEQLADAARQLTADRLIVLAPVFLDGASLGAEVPDGLDRLHRRRIDLADRVLVVDPGGYVGPSTASEIGYALRVGRRVEFTEPPVAMRLDDEPFAALAERRKRVEVRLLDDKRATLQDGHLIAFTRNGDPDGVALLARVTALRSHANRGALLGAVDPGLVLPGADRDGLAARLERCYPGRDAAAHVAIGLELLGGIDPDRRTRVGYLRALPRALGSAAVLIRDERGRILLVNPAYRDEGWLLPGGTLKQDEYPAEAAAREATKELALAGFTPGRLLVVDYQHAYSEHPALTGFLFEGGVLPADRHASIRLPPEELSAMGFFTLEQVRSLVAAHLYRRIKVAHRALLAGSAAVYLEDGYPPGQRPVFTWHEGQPPPDGVLVRQVGVWAFDPVDGRVLLQHREAERRYGLPAGRPEPGEQDDPRATMVREAWEESQIIIDPQRAVYLGYQSTKSDPAYPGGLVQLRYAAPILRYQPIAPDADPELGGARPAYRRFLTDIARAVDLLDWGPSGYAQARAAAQAARALGIPVDAPSPDGYRDHAHHSVAALDQGRMAR